MITRSLLRVALTMAVATTLRASVCAPIESTYRTPSDRTQSICFRSASAEISSNALQDAVATWCGGCGAVGIGIPNMTANPSSATQCSMTIDVRFDPNPDSQHQPAWDAQFASTVRSTTDKTLVGGTITCFEVPCTPLLIAHEIGHALGLGDAPSSGCGGHIMEHEVGDAGMLDACSQADALWLGPSSSDTRTGADVSGGSGGDGGSTGGGGSECIDYWLVRYRSYDEGKTWERIGWTYLGCF